MQNILKTIPKIHLARRTKKYKCVKFANRDGKTGEFHVCEDFLLVVKVKNLKSTGVHDGMGVERWFRGGWGERGGLNVTPVTLHANILIILLLNLN